MDQFIDETPTSVSATLIMPTPKSTLENLPSEVLSKICSNLLGGKTPICVNIARRVKDDQRPTFQRGVPEVFQQLKNLLSTSKTLRAHAQAWLARECQLYARSNNFTYFSEIFGRGNTILIQHLDLRLSFNEKIAHEKEWPKLLNMLVSELPHLANFKLSTSWQTGRPPYPPHESGDSFDSLTREGQETRTILRLGSFLILRHPTLRRMIWPADSGQTFEANENQSTVYVVLDRGMHKKPGDLKRTWKSVTKWTDETRASKVLSQDSILNTTAIRRHKNTDLANIPIDQLCITVPVGQLQDEIATSEVAEATDTYRLVDERGYTLPSGEQKRGQGIVSVDEWIDVCQEVDRNLSNRNEPANMVARELLEKRNVEYELRKSYDENDDLMDKLDQWHEIRKSAEDSIERLLDQLLAAKDAEVKANLRRDELEAGLREVRATIDREHPLTKIVHAVFRRVGNKLWTVKASLTGVDLTEE